MKAESNIMPQNQFVIDKVGEQAYITFFTDITPVQKTIDDEPKTIYKYNSYSLTAPYQNNLESIISENIQIWIDAAIQAEGKTPEKTIEERVKNTETKVVTIEETIDTLFGGTV